MLELYNKFLESKIKVAEPLGIDISLDIINPILKPHQRDIVRWCINGARRAVFAAFGLGKTFMELELARIITTLLGPDSCFLIGLPLGVRHQFKKAAKKLGIKIVYVTCMDDVYRHRENGVQIFMSNYERIREGNFISEFFAGIAFDEASVLRSMGTKTTQYILSSFKSVKFRYVFTATPSPNEYHELLKYSDFLGIMDISQALSRFFKRDSVKAHNSQLLEHREADFWEFMHSWACFITKPSLLGYDDTGYVMPELNVHWIEISEKETFQEADERGIIKMFGEPANDLSSAIREKRRSVFHRVNKLAEIVNESPDDHFILWHHLEDERMAIENVLPESKSVYGSQKEDIKEQLLLDFEDGKFKYLSTKPQIAGSGCNFQYHCHKAIFVGVDHKFNDFIQAVHRILRFMQEHEVHIYIIYTEAEREIVKSLENKWSRHNRLMENMEAIIIRNGLANITDIDKKRNFNVTRKEYVGKQFKAIHNDSVREFADTQQHPDNSVQLILSSIPFSDLFEYAESYSDMGQSHGDEEFFRHMDFLTPNLLRILEPGRIAAIHVKDCMKYTYQNDAGFITLNPFSDHTVAHFTKHGFYYIGRITIPTDVVQENAQTYRLGWSEQCKDGTKMSVGLPEYILLFRKKPSDSSNSYADNPVIKNKADYTRARWQLDAHALWKSNMNRLLTPLEIRQLDLSVIMKHWKEYDGTNIYDFGAHVQQCEELDAAGKLPSSFMVLPPQSNNEYVMDDVVRMHTLNSNQNKQKLVKHVCPLPFDIVDRTIERYSNPGDIVCDPFGGILTVPYRSIKLGRKAVACELNIEYWKDGVGHCRSAELSQNVPTLFDLLKEFQPSNYQS